jgi:hypothetical protein
MYRRARTASAVLTWVVLTATAHAIPPTVSVDASALPAKLFRRLDGAGLERRVIVRLVQDGFAVVRPAANPAIHVELRGEGSLVRIEVTRGANREVRRVRITGIRRAELHLEIAQKVAELVRSVAERSETKTGATGQSVPLEPSRPAGHTLHADASAEKARVAQGSANVQAPAPAASPEPAPPPAVDPPRPQEAPPTPSPLAIRVASAPVRAPAGLRQEAPEPERPRPLGLELQVSGTGLARAGGTDLTAQAWFRAGPWRNLGLVLGLGFTPASSPRIQVSEWQVQAGVGWRFELHRRVHLDATLAGGVLVHRHGSTGADDVSGSRLDFLASLRISLGFWATRALRIGLEVAPGLADVDRIHVQGAETVWQRGAARLESGISIGWRFR